MQQVCLEVSVTRSSESIEPRAPRRAAVRRTQKDGIAARKGSIRAKSSIESCVNATDHRCEWRLTMAMWGRMLLPPIHICPQEPWEAQEYRTLTGTGVGSNFLFDFVSDLDVETRLDLYQYAISSMDPCQLAWIHALSFLA